MSSTKVEEYIKRWGGGISHGGNERANLQMFITELCTLLDLPQPDPAGKERENNAYVFERSVTELLPEGGKKNRAIDLYKRGCFILEGKDTGKRTDTDSWGESITKALNQASNYARCLPAEEGRPPFIVVVDVGKSFAVYAEFSRSGGHYTPFPDARTHKIALEKLRSADTRELLRTLWLEPLKLDPTRYAGKVTRHVANQLAKLASSLEGAGHTADQVARFLMRSLFTMFAEDVGLLPERGFTAMLERCKSDPDTFHWQLESLWQTMNYGGFAPSLNAKIIRFNGGLFADATAIALDAAQIELLIAAARTDWRHVEPAIFGTLLERALNPRERHKLGAHYTPRAYVERLVMPTIIEPLRAEWAEVQATAQVYKQQRKTKDAIAEIQAFLHRLCGLRILDPACGSGNFLYVTLEHMKRLEGEVLEMLAQIKKSASFDMEGLTIDPHQFLGLEINPRAASIAEMVLWIGYLQWHYRTYGSVNPPEPVLRDFKNIECRDALIDFDAVEAMIDSNGQPVTRWDGVSYRKSPVTGENIPDESAQVPQYRYVNPRKASWPQADFIVGNPPFIGASTMRRALGDGYVDAVRSTWKEVPESADFVMHWWHIAAEKVRAGDARQFGFITTNSIKQTFNRRVVQEQLEAKNPLSLVFAIPDHPWVDSADGAAVRIAMTAGSVGGQSGRLQLVRTETAGEQDDVSVDLQEFTGVLFADLKMGANVTSAKPLLADLGLSSPGVKLHGAGFIITKNEAEQLGLGSVAGLEQHIREYRNGRDLTQSPRDVMVIDLFGLGIDVVRTRFPAVYQWIVERVKPERDQNNRATYRDNWWIFGEARKDWRAMVNGLPRYIATVETMKHRIFQFLDINILPDNKLVNIAINDAFALGVLSSRLHVAWAGAAGSRLGVGNDSVYVKTTCFETFPFPDATDAQKTLIRDLAEKLDAHRKRQQAAYPDLTLTGMYNVLEKLRSGEALNEKEKTIHTQGLVSILKELHDDLDKAVFAAYGWDDLSNVLVGLPGATTPLPTKSEAQSDAEETLLQRLVALNQQRAAEEAKGQIRWLRPEYQNRAAGTVTSTMSEQSEADVSTDEEVAPAAKTKKQPWPKTLREQMAVIRNTLGRQAMTPDAMAAQFSGSKTTARQIAEALGALDELGMATQENGAYRLVGATTG